MAYIRKRGNQLVIVQGEREPGSGKVKQRILFTIYSKAEATEILGSGEHSRDGQIDFEGRFRRHFPDIKVNWSKIQRGIKENLQCLPDAHEYRLDRLRGRFKESLLHFTKQLILADPQLLISSAHLIQENHYELEFLAELINWRLKLRDQEETQWNRDNQFYWRFALHDRTVPYDEEGQAVGLYEQGEYEKAEAVFRLLIDCFDEYAEGYNYLGLIAYQQRKFEQAIELFEKTIEVGRKLFPPKFSKKNYWKDLATRPYVRGLRNLVLTLNETCRYDEALVICDRLENECGDTFHADSYRAAIYLNTRRWERAADCAKRTTGSLNPSAGFVLAYALFELGSFKEALTRFLHAAIHYPRAARLLAGKRIKLPKKHNEARDYNAGIYEQRYLHAYLKDQPRAAKKFFRGLVCDQRVVELLDHTMAAVRRWAEEHSHHDRSAFDEMNRIKSWPFAVAEAHKLSDLLPGSGNSASAMK